MRNSNRSHHVIYQRMSIAQIHKRWPITCAGEGELFANMDDTVVNMLLRGIGLQTRYWLEGHNIGFLSWTDIIAQRQTDRLLGIVGRNSFLTQPSGMKETQQEEGEVPA